MERGALEALVRWLRSGRPPEPTDPAVDAARLVDAAEAQRLAPLLYAALAERDGWPDAEIARLRDLHHAAFARGARQLELVAGVLADFDRRGVRALPLKGAALAESAYESIADRPMGDVDVLVLEGWDAAVEALRDRGMEELGRADHAWTFREKDGVALELHHSVTSCPGLYPVDAGGLWERSRAGSGQVPRCPGAEDLLVQLALHAAFQHALMLSLGQYLDFKRLLAAPAFDPERFERVAEEARAGPAVAASFAVADALVGLDLGPGLRSWVEARRPGALERWLASGLQDPLVFVLPGPHPLVRVRWGLLRGRRLRLLACTLAPRQPGARPPLALQALQVTARARGLVTRWLLPR